MKFLAIIALCAFSGLATAQISVEIYQVKDLVIKQKKGDLPYALTDEGKLAVDFQSLESPLKSHLSDDEGHFYKVASSEVFINGQEENKSLVFVTSSENSTIINDCKDFSGSCAPIIKLNNERIYLNTKDLSELNQNVILGATVFSELKANVRGFYSLSEDHKKMFNVIDIEFTSKEELQISDTEDELIVSAQLEY